MTDDQRLKQLLELRARIDMEIDRLEANLQARVNHRRARRQKIAACGTVSGYYRHHRIDHTPPCDSCKAARAVDERLRNLRKREAQLQAAA